MSTLQAEQGARVPSSEAKFQHQVNQTAINSIRLNVPTKPNLAQYVATASDGNMLDLVSGFDTHAASLNSKKTDITVVLENHPSSTTWPKNSHFFSGGVGESPCITSKSFDEMHKCLGILPSNPSHLDLNMIRSNNKANTTQPTMYPESPYITSKSFDDMHKCLGMSHFDLTESSEVENSQDNDSTESSSAYAESSAEVETDINIKRDLIDPRRYQIAFSPFDGTRVLQDQTTDPCNFDMQRDAVAPRQTFHSIDNAPSLNTSNRYWRYVTEGKLILKQRSNGDIRNVALTECGLATFMNNRDLSTHPQAVSTNTSERSSDRGVNSSPDYADVQSD